MKKLLMVLVVAGLVVVGSSVMASAVTINGTIDGTEWNNPGGAHWLHASDPDESLVTQQDFDASDFYITDDGTNIAFRFDVFGTPGFLGDTYYAVYIDTDSNSSTGWGFAQGMGLGADARVLYNNSGATAAQWDGSSNWTSIVSAAGGQGSITEIGTTFSALGISNPNQKVLLRGFVDGATEDPDDYIVPIGYPVPEPASMALLGMGLLGAIGAGFRRKRR